MTSDLWRHAREWSWFAACTSMRVLIRRLAQEGSVESPAGYEGELGDRVDETWTEEHLIDASHCGDERRPR